MIKLININVTPRQAYQMDICKEIAATQLHISKDEITLVRIVRRSVDARGKIAKINLGLEVYIGESPVETKIHFEYQNVADKEEVLIVGAGPAGLFAALRLIELGYKPVVVERGKDVSQRKRDIGAIHRNEAVNPDSNYGFGEGGAGTFSDGKLYTRSKKRGDINKVLEVLHFHGAQSEILIDAHPHIGTNVLPRVIVAIRESILNAGGEVLFNHRVSNLIIEGDNVGGVVFSNGLKRKAKAVILATGHSARDIYYMLRDNGIHLEGKNFAVGVRVEHPQEIIDSIQYHRSNRGEYLPPAIYSYAEQVEGRGVYSFCMCPGGVIVPAATATGEMVVNGMSPSDRNGKFANAGMVVEIRLEDLKQYTRYRELAGLKFQEEIEKKCFKMANNSMIAPAQRLADFVSSKNSIDLPSTSYHPGIDVSDMHRWIPPFITSRLQEGFKLIDRKSKGFLTNEAKILGIESRTSSPIRIPRDNDTFEHVKMKRLFPCGEGAGYAGGIVSSAIDGELCANKVAELLNKTHV